MRRNMLKLAVGIIVILSIFVTVILIMIRDVPGEMMKEAISLRDSGSSEAAAEKFGEVALVYPDSKYADEALFEKGFTYYYFMFPKAEFDDQGEFIRVARDSFETIVKKYPKSEYVEKSRLYLAEIYSALGEDEKALRNYEAAAMVITDPVELQEIYHFMAQKYDRVGRHEDALDSLKKIIELNITGRYYENAFLSLARYYRVAATESEDKSNEYFQRVIDLLRGLISREAEISESTLQESLMIIAHSMLELKRFDECEATLDRLENLNVSQTNRALMADYRERLQRQRTMGKN